MIKLNEQLYADFYDLFKSHGAEDPDASIQDMCKQIETSNLLEHVTLDQFLTSFLNSCQKHSKSDMDKMNPGMSIDHNKYPQPIKIYSTRTL